MTAQDSFNICLIIFACAGSAIMLSVAAYIGVEAWKNYRNFKK